MLLVTQTLIAAIKKMSDYAGYNELEQIYSDDDSGAAKNGNPAKRFSKNDYESQCHKLREDIKRNNQLIVVIVVFFALLISIKNK